jgi:large subunit ribosomal protein L18
MKQLRGTSARMRLRVFVSNRHIYGQIINDEKRIVITSVSTLNPDIRKNKKKTPKERAKEVGKLIAAGAQQKKIKRVVFDRAGHKYHGKVKELADGAREAGLEF